MQDPDKIHTRSAWGIVFHAARVAERLQVAATHDPSPLVRQRAAQHRAAWIGAFDHVIGDAGGVSC